MRRIGLTFVLAVAVVTGCGGAGATPGAPASGDHPTATTPGGDGGNATARITFNGDTFDLSGGNCENAGVLGWEVTAGDYNAGQAGQSDFLDVIVGNTKVSGAQGRSGGVYWTLGNDQTGSIGSGMAGTFSGTDTISGSHVEGTFACN